MHDFDHEDGGRYKVVKWMLVDDLVRRDEREELFDWLLGMAQENYFLDEVKWLLDTNNVYHVWHKDVMDWYRREVIHDILRNERKLP